MSILSKRTTVYFEPTIHQDLKVRAAYAIVSLSEIVDEAVRALMNEDLEISYEELLIDLKKQ